ncbi:hypothetical protein HY310_03810 [Candidatus Microgenomates bacterium]|nr:hypothetical protein [Candidatus Microgenomates bacterium]
MVDSNEVYQFLKGLGLREEEITIFSALSYSGPLSTLELSRKIDIPRTSIYRILEEMKKQGFVEEVLDQYHTKSQAVSFDKIRELLKDKERQIKEISEKIPIVESFLSGRQSFDQPGTKVLFYRGVEGIKQMIWNSLKAKEQLRGFTFQNWNSLVSDKFICDWSYEFEAKNIPARDLVSDEYLKNRLATHHLGTWKNWTRRYFPNKKLTIDHQADIYNDTVAFYHWEAEEIFGVEIHNEKVAKLQKQIFDILWEMGTPMSKTTDDAHRSQPIKGNARKDKLGI